MHSDNLQQLFAGTRHRFGVSLLAIIAVSVLLPVLIFSVGLSTQGAYPFLRISFYVLVLLIGILLISLYVLRLRQIQRPRALAILALVPLANIIFPVFLMIENSPSERAGKLFFIFTGVLAAALIGLVSYNFTNPPGFSRADPTGCYLVNGKPIFQLRTGKVLLPSGAATGVAYHIEADDFGNAVVSDHELRLARSDSGLKLAIGVAGNRWNSSVDGYSGPEMIMTIGDELQPIMAARHDQCS